MSTSVTKKPKKVKLLWKEEVFTSYRSEYTCPSCYATFQGFLRDRQIIRFRCRCGQELIVEEIK